MNDIKDIYPPKDILINKIKEVTIPLDLVSELIGKRLVTEKSGPGFLLLWNDVILGRLSSKELLSLLFKLNFDEGYALTTNYEKENKRRSGKSKNLSEWAKNWILNNVEYNENVWKILNEEMILEFNTTSPKKYEGFGILEIKYGSDRKIYKCEFYPKRNYKNPGKTHSGEAEKFSKP